MTRKMVLIMGFVMCWTILDAQTRRWSVQDGLPTGEVRQIVALPNHQMLINCEGVFCITNGAGVSVVPCDRRRTYKMEHYADSVGYGYYWQGDSLLWLCDFYRIYLFDTRTRSFRYDIEERLRSLGPFTPSPEEVCDWQGGTWTATPTNGILYTPPARQMAVTVSSSDSLVAVARKYEKMDVKLNDGRRLQCRGLNQIGYLIPDENRFITLNKRLPQLNNYRYIVGACAVDKPWAVLYTQNGACLLNTETDTLSEFPATKAIGEYTDKYNCMVREHNGTLWVGTQNGLFQVKMGRPGSEYCKTKRVIGLSNNCIRSLVVDASGRVWAGTACGITRITPTVINYSEDDGIPPVSMMERAAYLNDDGRLVLVHHSSAATVFNPEWLSIDTVPSTPVLTALYVNGQSNPITNYANPMTRTAASQPLTLPYDKNYLTFHFSSLNYAQPSHVHYRYRLSGLEDEWHIDNETKGLAVADYKSLSPGNYLFEAQAALADGEWSKTLTVRVNVQPPFWLTWWAKIFYCLIVLMGVTVTTGRYLKRKREKMERENDEKVNRLFEMREEARHQFANNTNIDPKKIGVNPEEEALVAKLLKAVETHIADEDYGVDQLATDVALSRTNLYSKLRNILGISPADFIRNVRLKRAAQLLTDNPTISINDVSIRVGFSTPRNFSTQFKKMFGVLPSEYRGIQSPT